MLPTQAHISARLSDIRKQSVACMNRKRPYYVKFLFTTRRNTGEVVVQLHSFLTSMLPRLEWLLGTSTGGG